PGLVWGSHCHRGSTRPRYRPDHQQLPATAGAGWPDHPRPRRPQTAASPAPHCDPRHADARSSVQSTCAGCPAASRADRLRRRRRISAGQIALYIALIAVAIVMLAPVMYMVSQAFTPEQDTLSWPIQYIPARPTLDNFYRVFSDPTLPVFRWFLNSMVASVSITTLVLLVSSLSAYAFARLEF